MTSPILENPSVTLPTVLDRLGSQFGEAPAILSGSEALSYRTLAKRAAFYASWAISRKIGHGDAVCLLAPNSAEYLAIWLGITRVGGIVALINTNLRGAPLAHSIGLVSPSHIIVGNVLFSAFEAVREQLPPGIICWVHGENIADLPRIDAGGENVNAQTIAVSISIPTIHDTALYIYTSGTTGLPKAVPISHFRLMQWSYWFAGLMGIVPADRMYNCLPMYHSAGGVVAICAPLVAGGSVVLPERFSVREFWADIARWDCTLFQYIGEMCRYLLKGPTSLYEGDRRIRLCCGNGLSGDIWNTFQDRFKIPQILEFYASTEGSISLYNCDGRPGAIGRIPPYLAHRFPIELVKCDFVTGQPVRGEDGFCTPCAPNEPGHAVSRIFRAGSGQARDFKIYTDPLASEQKILRNVFDDGDAWYLTGDLLLKDKSGYYHFVDRVGDTFRWKGENVSAAEIEDVIRTFRGVTEALVYGVKVPNAEGRAGMVAVLPDEEFDLASFHETLTERLPHYARPLFLRLVSNVPRTETFKPQKQQLKLEGYNPNLIADRLYFNSQVDGIFTPLDIDTYELIQCAEIRL